MLNFGERLKKLRKDHHLTQKQLAGQIHIHDSIISAYENGSRLPSLDALMGLSAVFHVSTDYLLGKERQQTIDTTGLTVSQLAAVRAIVGEFQTANKERR